MSSKEIMESGLLELYAMGCLSGADLDLVGEALSIDPLLKHELDEIEKVLMVYAQANAINPGLTVKPLLMAKVDYTERLKMGEVIDSLPELNPDSKVADFERWLGRDNLQLSENFREVEVKIVAQEPDKMTAIVWLKSGAPDETHTNEHEKFLIVEGTCDLTIGTNVHHLMAGDYLPIPLYVNHNVRVTSDVPCKIILQRVNVTAA